MLGIDVGSYSVKVAVVKGSGKKASVSKFVQEVIPFDIANSDDPQVKKNFVSDVIRRVGKAEKVAAIAIPTSAAILKTVELPNGLSDEELEGEIQLALINLVPFPLDQVYLDFVSLGPKKNNAELQDVLVAVSRRAIVDAASDNINIKTVKEKIVDIEAMAIGQLIENVKGRNYQDAYAIIDIGLNATNVYMYANNQLLFSREQQIGGHQLTEAISDGMGVSLEDAELTKLQAFGTVPGDVVASYVEAFVEQVALAFELYESANNVGVSGIYITGGGGNVDELIPALKVSLNNQNIELFPVSDCLKVTSKFDNKIVDTLSSVSIGLALRS